MSLLVLAFLVLHIITSVLDSFAPIALTDAVIPLGASYRPLWMGLGALSFDLLIALVVTSLLRRRFGYERWRAVHWLAYASWPVAVLHGLGTGSDTKLVVDAGAHRGVRGRRPGAAGCGSPAPGRRRRAAGPASRSRRSPPLGIAIFTLAGPLQPGWARRAGTPPTLLGTPSRPRQLGRPGAWPARRPATLPPRSRPRCRDDSTQTPAGGALVDMALRLSGRANGRLRIRIAGRRSPAAGCR